jgi:hypothetical protein
MEKFVVPRNVGDSPEIFGVTAEQGVLFGVSIIAGLWFSAALYGFLAGIVLGMAYGRVSKKYPDGPRFPHLAEKLNLNFGSFEFHCQ